MMLVIFKATKTRKLACGVFFTALALATHNAGAQTPGAPPTAMAQAPSAPVPPRRNVDAEVLQMTKRYDLSTSQAAQLHAILDDETKKTEAMLADGSLTPIERLMKLKSFRDEETARVSRILTPEQLDKYLKDLQPKPPPQFQPPAGLPAPPTGL